MSRFLILLFLASIICHNSYAGDSAGKAPQALIAFRAAHNYLPGGDAASIGISSPVPWEYHDRPLHHSRQGIANGLIIAGGAMLLTGAAFLIIGSKLDKTANKEDEGGFFLQLGGGVLCVAGGSMGIVGICIHGPKPGQHRR